MKHSRKVKKDDIILKYSLVCPMCLTEFKEGQEIVDDELDYYHRECWREKHGD